MILFIILFILLPEAKSFTNSGQVSSASPEKKHIAQAVKKGFINRCIGSPTTVNNPIPEVSAGLLFPFPSGRSSRSLHNIIAAEGTEIDFLNVLIHEITS